MTAASDALNSVADVRSQTWRVIAATSIGNALEWFDFVIFGFLAATMARLFFPASDQTASLLLTFGTFGLTFLVRPLGAVLIGAYADRRGRKAALTLTITLMTLGTMIIALAPTYSTAGAWAALIIIVARTVQGLSVGGEFGTATTFLVEQDSKQRGFLASWQFASQGLTTILATGFGVGLSTALTSAELEAWGWRIPFVFGVLIGPVAYYIRTRLHETPEFSSTTPMKAPFRGVISQYKKQLLFCIGLIVLATVTTYTVLFMPTFAVRQLGLSSSGAFLGGLLTGVIHVLLVPLIGYLSDRRGRTPFALGASIAILLLSYPLFVWLVADPSLWTLLIVQALLGILSAIYVGAIGGLISELFTTPVRTSGLSIGNALAVTIFGGFAPFISTWLIEVTGSKVSPSFYLILASGISVAALIGVRRLGFR